MLVIKSWLASSINFYCRKSIFYRIVLCSFVGFDELSDFVIKKCAFNVLSRLGFIFWNQTTIKKYVANFIIIIVWHRDRKIYVSYILWKNRYYFLVFFAIVFCTVIQIRLWRKVDFQMQCSQRCFLIEWYLRILYKM